MRILQICSARSIGGGERHVIDLSDALARRGHDVFAAVVPGSPVAAQLSELTSENILTVPLRNALDVKSAIAISKFARRNNVELINAHLAKDYPVAAAAARLARIPYVITRHVLFPMNRLHRRFLREVRFVIAPSNAVAESLRSHSVFPKEKIVTIRYGLGVGEEVFIARRRNASPVVGMIGNIDPVKGPDVFVRAAAIVREKIPDVTFRIVGEDRSRDGRNEKALRELIARLGLEDAVEIAGWSDDVYSALAEFDLFVSASRSESFGFVIAEAMLAGVPVVATATEGAKEIISEDSLGVIVPLESTEALAANIVQLLNDDERLERLSGSGREHVRRHFSLDRMVDETEALYRRVLVP